MRKFTVLLALLFLSLQVSLAQGRMISGTVTSTADGSAIPGATVLVKGTTVGMTTDLDGTYKLLVPENARTLVFSFVGMKTKEVPLGSSNTVNVALEPDVLDIEGVVVTALGISREKKSLGYAVQEASGEVMSRSANPDLQSTISGKFSGVEVRQSSGMPGAPAQIFIRGARSFSGDNTPLYVVDGMPISSTSDYTSNVTGSAFSNRAIDIDPNDIESINVLKGQAAAALYGLRASNGVVIITTKKGRAAAGAGKVGPVVTINSSVTIDNVSRLPEVQQTYAQGYNGAFAPANSFSWGPKITDLPDNATYGGNNYPGNEGKFFDPYKGMWVTPTAFNNPEGFYDNNGYTYNNSINVANASRLGNYSIGFGSTNQSGIIKNTGMDRYTAKIAGDFQMNEKWKMGYSGNYSDSKIDKLPSGNDSWLFTVYGAPPSFDLVGTPFSQEGTNGDYRQISYRRGAVGKNPYWVLENSSYVEQTKRFFGNGYLEFTPANWVRLRYQIGVDQYTTDNAQYTEMGQGDLPAASQYPTPDNPVYAYLAPTGGVIDHFGVTRRIINSLFTATFTHSFNDDLSGDLVIGNEVDHNASEYYRSYGTGFTTPGWNNLANTNTQNAAYDKYARRTAGFFANLNLDYLNMFYFNLTGRQDIVSSMPRDNRTFFYPSTSLSWVFTEMDALRDNKFLPYGKARVSYAQVGQAAATYLADPYFVTGGANSGFLTYGIEYPWQGITGYKYSSTLYSPDLIPQNTNTFEIGFDLRFLNNRIGLDYSFFNQIAKDQIFAVPMAGSTGYSQMVMNAGEMKGVGHEIILTITPVKTDKFEWNFITNFTKITNEVIELAEGVENIALGGYVTPNIRASAGDIYPAIYGEQFVKDDQGRILVDEDPNSPGYGLPMAGEFGKIGVVSPDFILTFRNDFRIFRDINVFAQLDWKQGGQMYSGTNRLMDLYGTSKRTEDRETPFIYDGYLSNGQPNNIERGGPDDALVYQTLYSSIIDGISEAHIYGTGYLKLREVGISYNLPHKYISSLKLSRASIGFVARNILLWSELPYFDPETSQGQGNMTGGMDYMSLPQTTSYGFNLSLTF
jgi:TonB-linked SusC/RagA family outer membrane protein